MTNLISLPSTPAASVHELTRSLRDVAALPLADARSLPSSLYGNPALLELERREIFQSEWVCIGRADQLPRPGDYITDAIDGQAIVAIRQKDGAIKIFSNSCLHRLTTLAVGEGHLSGPLVCPYHAWSYNVAGGLIATPYSSLQKDAACKGETLKLREFACEVWGGFLFVSLAEDPEPLAHRLAGLERQLPAVAMERYHATRKHDEIWECDWKILVDNFVEGYHIFTVHKDTLEPITPTKSAVMKDGGDAFSLQYYSLVKEATSELAHRGKAGVADGERGLVFTFQVFPSFIVSGSHNWLWWMSIQPLELNRAKLRWGICLTPEIVADPALAAYPDELDAFIATANNEDMVAVTRAREGISGPLPLVGRLTTLDQPIWEFIRYLGRALGG
jgi:nitrite reductase/ring-hydroxylating ferredoxin subunit